jgi:hypothetical protein
LIVVWGFNFLFLIGRPWLIPQHFENIERFGLDIPCRASLGELNLYLCF